MNERFGHARERAVERRAEECQKAIHSITFRLIRLLFELTVDESEQYSSVLTHARNHAK